MLKPGQVVKKFVSKNENLITIRGAKSSDAQDLRLFREEFKKEYLDNKKVTLRETKKFLESSILRMKQGDFLLIYALLNEKVVGECNLERRPGTSSHTGELMVFINQKFRREGVGTELITQVLRTGIKTMGIKIATLSVRKTNMPAIELYKKLGFKKIGILPKGYRVGSDYVDKILMYKEL